MNRFARKLIPTMISFLVVSCLGIRYANAVRLASAVGPGQDAGKEERFAAASIKPSRVMLKKYQATTAELAASGTLADFIQYSYGVSGDRILGLPGWATQEFYEVAAKANGPTSRADMARLLGNLLRDRFALDAVESTREADGFELVIGKGPTKLGPEMPGPARSGPDLIVDSMDGLAGRLRVDESGYETHQATYFHVVNHTGIAGMYNIYPFFKDIVTLGPADYADEDGTRAHVKTVDEVLRETLGLELKRAQIRERVIIVRGAAKPGPD